MDSLEENCKHNRITRNCYLCHLEFNYPQERNALDTLHETISELKIRVSKIEAYERLQDDLNISLVDHRKKQIDENRAISKHLTELDESNAELNSRQNDVESDINILTARGNDLDFKLATIPKNLENMMEVNVNILHERLAKIEKNITYMMGDPSVQIHKPKETLCMDKFTRPYTSRITNINTSYGPKWEDSESKNTGLTFEEALSAFKAGKKIRINDGLIPTIAYDHSPDMDFLFKYADMCRDCWEIVE